MEICRFCSKSRKSREISKITDKKLQIIEKLKEIFKITLNTSQNHSNFICRICIKKLNSSHSFYQQIIEVQKKLDENVEDSKDFEFKSIVIKEEVNDESVKEEIEVDLHFGDGFDDSDGFEDDKNDEFYSKNNRSEDKIENEEIEVTKKGKKTKTSKSIKLLTSKTKKSTKKSKLLDPIENTSSKQDFLTALYQNEHKGLFTDQILTISNSSHEAPFKWSNYDYKCDKCSSNFPNIVKLNSHLKSTHKSKYKTYCNLCGIHCLNYPSYVTHIIKYHVTNARFSCILCSQFHDSLLNLHHHYINDHMSTKDINFPRIIMCLYCGYHYNTTQMLRNHLTQKHHREDNRSELECDFCGFKTKSRETIAGHMFNHMKSTKQICEQCGSIFNRRGELAMHITFVHSKSLDIKCHCGKSFKTMMSLRKHKKHIHNKHLIDHKYECQICNKKYRSAYLLKSHQYSHNPDSFRYQCPHCDKGFRYTTGFKYHVRSAHTNEKPYACPACDMKFFDYANANKHVKGSHGGDLKPFKELK